MLHHFNVVTTIAVMTTVTMSKTLTWRASESVCVCVCASVCQVCVCECVPNYSETGLVFNIPKQMNKKMSPFKALLVFTNFNIHS